MKVQKMACSWSVQPYDNLQRAYTYTGHRKGVTVCECALEDQGYVRTIFNETETGVFSGRYIRVSHSGAALCTYETEVVGVEDMLRFLAWVYHCTAIARERTWVHSVVGCLLYAGKPFESWVMDIP